MVLGAGRSLLLRGHVGVTSVRAHVGARLLRVRELPHDREQPIQDRERLGVVVDPAPSVSDIETCPHLVRTAVRERAMLLAIPLR